MHSIEVSSEVSAALDTLDTGDAAIRGLNFDVLTPAVRLLVLERMEASQRRQIAASHDVIASLAKEDPADVGGPVHKVIGDSLRISYAEARRRLHDAEQLSERLTLTGQELPPELPATAKAWRAGELDAQHLRVIQGFFRDLPDATPADVVDQAERFLAEQAAKLRPDQLEKAAHRLALHLNPDGNFSDSDRARQRAFTWCGQRSDGMSIGRLVASPELRANIDGWLARFAAPGMCNPDDEAPGTADEPADEATHRDVRTPGQRRHDALNALVRSQLGDPKLGRHNGLPVTVVVSTTLQELTTGTGRAVTGSGTLLPMRDVIRMASHAYHYLAVFDEHQSRPLYLGRSRRVATPDQRVVLYAKDRGCTHPGCDTPGYWCEVHHVDDWAGGGSTDADQLTFACKPHHKLVGMGWRTRKLANGRTEWIPPPQFDVGTGTNDYHHPERQFPTPISEG
ncbi:HNH endonuclease signature motif containing protein [Mycobacterium sp. Aquia_216]|uniref:HNH endonuclease signature motif containing protein n=1 Tax=Mycobacterium sp. Aquia_216 TaxID=2991729 RepID=UPI00227A1051|nr:HNH endonuclease signature motif containing protein [Mycobacterium sp. Aquia_216]WAJ46990.1 HNH endonuclease signature motif containing protein [Mycobacterium sp. Aquia_216]